MGAKLSSGGGSKLHIEQNAEINVTPFVDVMLVLLIIFMVAAPLATVSVEVKLPKATAKPTVSPPKTIYISLKKDTSLFIMNSPTDLDSLGDDLKKSLGQRDPDQERIYIRCDKQTRYAEFMKVMNKLQDNGFYSVALVGEDNNS
jgi:biopolymer transport protein ExbD/biopolymer transport protein TolR